MQTSNLVWTKSLEWLCPPPPTLPLTTPTLSKRMTFLQTLGLLKVFFSQEFFLEGFQSVRPERICYLLSF